MCCAIPTSRLSRNRSSRSPDDRPIRRSIRSPDHQKAAASIGRRGLFVSGGMAAAGSIPGRIAIQAVEVHPDEGRDSERQAAARIADQVVRHQKGVHRSPIFVNVDPPSPLPVLRSIATVIASLAKSREAIQRRPSARGLASRNDGRIRASAPERVPAARIVSGSAVQPGRSVSAAQRASVSSGSGRSNATPA